jgi:hypothetical protein
MFPRIRRPLLATLLLLAGYYLAGLGVEEDTRALVEEARASWACVVSGGFPPCPGAGQFALLQKIPALVGVWLGLKTGLIIRLLAILNIFVFCVALGQGFRALSTRSLKSARLFLLALLSGPWLWYARSSFSEGLASSLLMLFAASLVLRAGSVRIFLLGLLGVLSKETAAPFVVLLGSAAAWFADSEVSAPARTARLKKVAVVLLGAALLGAGMHLSRNLFAFGTVMNKAYEPWVGLRPPWADFASFFGAQWVSPVYGVIASSPVWFAVIALALFRSSVGFALPLCLSLFGLTWGFAGWISPTGGVNWGHRLIHPWLGAWLLLALWVLSGRTHREELARVGAWMRSSGGRGVLCAAGLLAAICAFVQYRALFGDDLVLALFSPDSVSCPEGVISLGVSAHYSCLNYRFWSQVPVLVQVVNPIRAPLAALAALLCTGLFVWQGRQILTRILGLPKRS